MTPTRHADSKPLDIAHISFLKMIETALRQISPQFTKGTMMRASLGTGESFAETAFGTWEDFLAAIDTYDTPLAQLEGPAEHMGNGIFGLGKCPFADSINDYKAVYGKLPPEYKQITADFNKPSQVTEDYRIGHGAGVSPFCAIHQTVRSAAGMKVKIGGKQVLVYQLGCKAGSGAKGFADKWIENGGFDKGTVDKVLDDHMCCYGVVLEG